jgi:hypothetical protein
MQSYAENYAWRSHAEATCRPHARAYSNWHVTLRQWNGYLGRNNEKSRERAPDEPRIAVGTVAKHT